MLWPHDTTCVGFDEALPFAGLILAAKASNDAQSSGRKNALRLLLDAQDENGEKVSMSLCSTLKSLHCLLII